jgi:murein DD-endopeptidase MepM/ murein hydrolase activator NlpD
VVEAETKERPKLLWPTALRVINQYYGWRHTGVDIDGDYKDPIYASEDGVVETAGWNSGGYGLQIVINHQNGMKTRYAHASKLFVKVGQAVKRGEVIAMVGTTGRSTGTHLHYEVYVGGVRKNPLAYTK